MMSHTLNQGPYKRRERQWAVEGYFVFYMTSYPIVEKMGRKMETKKKELYVLCIGLYYFPRVLVVFHGRGATPQSDDEIYRFASL